MGGACDVPVEDPDHTADDQGAHGEPADDESADFDLPLDGGGMTLAELKKAFNDPDDPRHAEAKELNAKLAAISRLPSTRSVLLSWAVTLRAP